jgi:Flp pilus assembly protein TadD
MAERMGLALVLGLGALAYAAVVSFELVWDDTRLVPAGPALAEGSPRALLLSEFRLEGEGSGFYRPLVTVTYFLESGLFGAHPAGYHVMNVAYHLAAALALAWMARRLTGSGQAGWIAGLVFALHPIHTESVAFVSGRTDVLAALFTFVAVGAWLRPGSDLAAGARAGVAFLLALAAKEVAMALPLVLAAHQAVLGRGARMAGRADGVGATARRALPVLVAAGGYLAVRQAVLGWPLAPGAARGAAEAGLAERVAMSVEGVGRYLLMLLAPYPPRLDMEVPSPTVAAGVASLLALGGLGALSAWAWPRSRLPAFLLAWFVLTLLPSLPVVPVARPQMAERFLYLPSAAWAVLVGWGADHLLRNPAPLRQAAAGGLAAVVLGALGLTLWRSEDWRTEERLYLRMAETSPRSWRAALGLGYLYLNRSELPDARVQFERALVLRPDRPGALMGLALVASRGGRHAEAIVLAERALGVGPVTGRLALQSGIVYGAAGRPEEAGRRFAQAARLEPHQPEPRYLLALALARAGRGHEARTALAEADALLGALRRTRPSWHEVGHRVRTAVAEGASR